MHPKIEATQQATDNLLARTMPASSKAYISQFKDSRWEHDRCTSPECTATSQQARSAATNYLKHAALWGQEHTSAIAINKIGQQQMATQPVSLSAAGRLTSAHALDPNSHTAPHPCQALLRLLLHPSGNRTGSNQFNASKTAIVSGYIIILNSAIFSRYKSLFSLACKLSQC